MLHDHWPNAVWRSCDVNDSEIWSASLHKLSSPLRTFLPGAAGLFHLFYSTPQASTSSSQNLHPIGGSPIALPKPLAAVCLIASCGLMSARNGMPLGVLPPSLPPYLLGVSLRRPRSRGGRWLVTWNMYLIHRRTFWHIASKGCEVIDTWKRIEMQSGGRSEHALYLNPSPRWNSGLLLTVFSICPRWEIKECVFWLQFNLLKKRSDNISWTHPSSFACSWIQFNGLVWGRRSSNVSLPLWIMYMFQYFSQSRHSITYQLSQFQAPNAHRFIHSKVGKQPLEITSEGLIMTRKWVSTNTLQPKDCRGSCKLLRRQVVPLRRTLLRLRQGVNVHTEKQK